MKYALVDACKTAASPRRRGQCPVCGSAVYAKCGEIRVWHWAHVRGSVCDPWWENETPWHRAWKEAFPVDCQEIVHCSESGEKHVADIKTDHGRVIEFRRSPLKKAERSARENFYKQMAWLVNGLHSEILRKSFDKQLCKAIVIHNTPIKLSVPKVNCKILKNWSNSKVGVYMDFGDSTFSDERFKSYHSVLWRIFPDSTKFHVEIAPIWRSDFISAALNGSSMKGINDPRLAVEYTHETISAPESQGWWEPSKNERRECESDIDYSIRVWGFFDNNIE